MHLNLRSLSGEPLTVHLHETRDETLGTTEWKSSEQPNLAIYLDASGKIFEITVDPGLSSTREEIADQFISYLADAALREAGGIEPSDDASEDGDDNPFPYNPESIRVDTKPFNISLVYDMIKDGDINLSPDFQRQFVWTDLGARSRLIESIMLRIPLPVFYMAQDKSGRLHVVDGLQRLTVIRQFLDNELRLRDLEYLKDEEGKIFRHDDPSKCIDQSYRKRILQTQIMMNIIDPQTPTDVKFDIFKRINQGGRPLNAQEIRNCMSTTETRTLIGTLSKSNEFLSATGSSVGTVRMQDQELVLRFLAFRLSEDGDLVSYHGNMDRFLDQAVDLLNQTGPEQRDALAASFYVSMRNAKWLFGQYAFRKCLPWDLAPGARRRLINNSLFTSWSVTLASFSEAHVAAQSAGSFAHIIAEELENDPQFLDCVTSGTNDRRRLSYTFSVARRLCEVHL